MNNFICETNLKHAHSHTQKYKQKDFIASKVICRYDVSYFTALGSSQISCDEVLKATPLPNKFRLNHHKTCFGGFLIVFVKFKLEQNGFYFREIYVTK